MAIESFEDVMDQLAEVAYSDYLKTALYLNDTPLARLVEHRDDLDAWMRERRIEGPAEWRETSRDWEIIEDVARGNFAELVTGRQTMYSGLGNGTVAMPLAWADGTHSILAMSQTDVGYPVGKTLEELTRGIRPDLGFWRLYDRSEATSWTNIELDGPAPDPLGLARLLFTISKRESNSTVSLGRVTVTMPMACDDVYEEFRRLEDIRGRVEGGEAFVDVRTGTLVYMADHFAPPGSCCVTHLRDGWREAALRGERPDGYVEYRAPGGYGDLQLVVARVATETVAGGAAARWISCEDTDAISLAFEKVDEVARQRQGDETVTPEALRAKAAEAAGRLRDGGQPGQRPAPPKPRRA